MVKAMVLAAGEGTRLRPLTLDKPKPMLPIAGRPLLEHTLALLRLHGIRDVGINLHHKPEVITDYFADAYGLNIIYSYEDSLLGTAGAVKKLASYLDTTFLLIYGDMLVDINISILLLYHRLRAALLTMAVYEEVEDPTRCGIVDVDETGRVLSFAEKPAMPTSRLANAGIYVIEPALLSHIPDGYVDFGHDVFPALIARGVPFYAWLMGPDSYYLDIGSPHRYSQACCDAREGRIQMLRLDRAGLATSQGVARC